MQRRLALHRPWPLDRASFIVSAGNADALALIDASAAWPAGRLALIGPEGSGKSHLAAIWAAKTGARIVPINALETVTPGAPLALEDADQAHADQRLFAVIEAASPDAPLLLTGRSPPRDWIVTLPDLRSRLNAIMVAAVSSPSDEVLAALLHRFFRERHIVPPDSVIAYLLRRIERSAEAALEAVERIDEAAAQDRRNITRDLVRKVLGEDLGETGSEG
ncbi:MAG: chromosomal replication initiator DnaA [Alphaproteobacteria bacterium]|nr:chromosomal replication initiator DnaA [Alphaproteobacteria bacterium]